MKHVLVATSNLKSEIYRTFGKPVVCDLDGFAPISLFFLNLIPTPTVLAYPYIYMV